MADRPAEGTRENAPRIVLKRAPNFRALPDPVPGKNRPMHRTFSTGGRFGFDAH